MNFLKKLSPGYLPKYVDSSSELMVLRERILQTLLLLFAFFTPPLIVLISSEAIQQGNGYLIFLYMGLYFAALFIVVSRELPYHVRGYTLLMLFFILALSELFESGQLGEVRMFLIVFCALTAILFNLKNVIISVLMGLATIIGAVMAPLFGAAIILQGTDWITASVMYVLLCSVTAGPISIIISGLQANVKKQAELTQSLEQERSALEQRVLERTRDMERSVVQIRTAAEISRTISALTDPDIMLPQVVEFIKDQFGLYYVGIFLVDAAKQNAVLRAGSGEAGRRMLLAGHHLPLSGNSMIGWSITHREPRIALDVGAEAVRFSNPHLPQTRSELALPIIAHDEVLGAMTIQSEEANAFNENDITVLRNIADSLAVALQNDQLFHETRQSLEEVRTLNHEYLQRAWAEAENDFGSLSFDYQNPVIPEGTDESTYNIQVPLMLRNETIGYITLEMDRSTLSEEEGTFMESVTTQTAVALENARLLHESERRAVQEQKLNELTTGFSRAMSIEEILKNAAQTLGQLPAVAEVSVQLNPVLRASGTGPLSPQNGNGNGKEHLR